LPTVHLAIHGRVQGVGYRWFVRETARRVGVAGWVRNRDDGSVELAADGPDDAIATLLDAVRGGPPGARVERVVDIDAGGLGDLPKPFAVMKAR
jgi:acylphosphatase